MGNLPVPEAAPPCPLLWCGRAHPDPLNRSHTVDLGTFEAGDVTVAMALFQKETGGVLADPVIRVFVDSTDHRRLDERADITPHAGAVLSDALTGLPLPQLGEFIAALARGQVVLGEREQPADFFDQTFMVTPRSALQAEADASIRHDEEGDR